MTREKATLFLKILFQTVSIIDDLPETKLRLLRVRARKILKKYVLQKYMIMGILAIFNKKKPIYLTSECSPSMFQ